MIDGLLVADKGDEGMPKRKYAILSMQRVVNFGSVLQAYSLREILREITGATATFLDIDDTTAIPSIKLVRESVDYDDPAAYPPGLLQRGKRWMIARLSSWNKHLIRTFMCRELQIGKESDNNRFDCVIVGSDEVFNHRRGISLQLHGEVQQTDRVISYAASCGSARLADIAHENVERVKEAMRRFSAVSVRDEATMQYVSALYDGCVEHHLDPVLVGNLYNRKHRSVKIKKYLLVYAYGQRIRTAEEIEAIKSFAKARNLKTVAMGGSQFWCDLYIPATPFRLLDYFYHADYVMTDTFHGAVFSVINHKKFAVIVRKTNRGKITGLLNDLNLQDRQVADLTSLNQILAKDIDYDAVDKILAQERIRTREYLKTQLEV